MADDRMDESVIVYLTSKFPKKLDAIADCVAALKKQAIEEMTDLKGFTQAELCNYGVPALFAKDFEAQGYLKPAVARESSQTLSDALQAILLGFRKELSDTISRMTPEQAFKNKFPLTKGPICQLKFPGKAWQPSLLFQGLVEQPLGSDKILSLLKISKPSLLILFGVSGAGKTRCLYEIAAQQPCLYFAGVGDGSPTAEGSRDLLVVAQTLERLYPRGAIPVGSLTICLRAVLLARLFIHKTCNELLKPLSNLAFLFKQVMHRQLNYVRPDPWAYLTERILQLVASVDDLSRLDSILANLLYDYSRGDYVIILDECQEVNRYLLNRFLSGSEEKDGDPKRSMLDKFVIALQDAGFNNTVIFAGTGRSLFHVATHISETLKNRVTISWYVSFGEFRDGESLLHYASTVLEDCSVIDFDRLGELYRGRYRTFVTALEQYIIRNPDASVATDFFVEFAKDTTTKRGASTILDCDGALMDPARILPTVNRTLLDDVYRFFSCVSTDELAQAKALVQYVVVNHFFGTGKVVILNPTLSLVEFGLARIYYKGQGVVQWVCKEGATIGHPDRTSGDSAQVEIWEPLVCRALWHYYEENGCLKKIQQQSFLDKAELSASATGEAYETAVAEMIGERLDGQVLADLFSAWNTDKIPDIYFKKAELARPRVDHINLVGRETHQFRLKHWIESVTSGKDTFYTFFSTGNNKTCGPDMWFFLILEGIFVICAAQMKTLGEMGRSDYEKAHSTLDFKKLFLHKKKRNGYKQVVKRKDDDEGAKLVREMAAANGSVKLIVTTDMVNVTKFQPRVRQRSMKTRKLNNENTQVIDAGLLGVIDSTNIHMFVDPWLVKSVRECKD